jgi:hypothetical protein
MFHSVRRPIHTIVLASIMLLAVAVPAAGQTLTTQATPTAPLGGSISDSATLAGFNNPTGSVTFTLYDNPTCSGAPIFVEVVAVAGNGVYPSSPFAPTAQGTYLWVAGYSGDPNNGPATTACGDPNEISVITAAAPTVTTQASASVPVGGIVTDTATLAGGSNPTGSIQFLLFGPSDPACAGLPIFASSVPVNGNGDYTSGNFVTSAAGAYNWTAVYGGDANNLPASSPCGAPNETVVVTQAAPTLTTTASGDVTIGGSVSDSGALSSGFNPTGTITFNLFGPNDPTCAGVLAFTATVPVAGNGTYGSGSFTPASTGAYNWTASYSGDLNNASATSSCGAPNESVNVNPATTTLTTTASPNVNLGGTVSDSGTLAGGNNPTGTISFSLFGPNDPTCAGAAAFTSSVPVAGNGAYASGNFTPTLAGTYNWTAAYSGDGNNTASSSPCGAPNESVTVGVAPTTLTTTASGTVTIGGTVSDTAALSGGSSPTGSITFNLYGPNNATCTGAPAFTSTVTVNGNGSYPSSNFVPTSAGTYRWTASYSGDVNNGSSSSPCNAANESVVVNQAAATLATAASPGVPVGGSITDTATIAGGFNPTGTITFTLFGPNNATCSGSPIFTSAVAVSGNGNYTSGAFTPVAAGTYRWVAGYGGDVNNAPANSPCNAANESVDVGLVAPTLTVDASPSAPLGSSVSSTATLAGGSSPTGTITFSLYGPDDATCSTTPVFTSTVTVTGNGTYPSGSFTPTAPGTYRWVARYSGDANNGPVATACTDPAGVVTIIAAVVQIPTLDPIGLALMTLALVGAGMFAFRARS